MKKTLHRMLCLFLATVLLAGLFAGCAREEPVTPPAEEPAPVTPAKPEEKPVEEEPQAPAEPPAEELPEEAPAEEPEEVGAVPEFVEIRDAEAPMLTALSLDGGYELAFEPELRTYRLSIPAGRPRIPRLAAEAAEGLYVTVDQAVLADTALYGTAYVTVKDGSGQVGEYKVELVKDESLGFHLQFNDQYAFTPDYELKEGEAFTFTTQDDLVLPVSEDGIATAAVLSDEPITLEARVGDAVVDTLQVDKIVPAPLNIFLIVGQSNAAGTYDITPGITETAETMKQSKDILCPAPGTVYCVDVNVLGQTTKPFYDLCVGRSGFSPALGKTWYDLTGEKTLMIQTAVGGSPIEAWQKPTDTQRNTYLDYRGNLYETTKNAYQAALSMIQAPGSGYELGRIHAYWLQGETGMANTYDPNKNGQGVGDWNFGSKAHILSAQEYHDIFMENLDYFQNEFGVEYMGVLLVRALEEVCSTESVSLQLLTDLVPARAAQYALNNRQDDVHLVSRVCDIARKESYADKSVEGWGYMGFYNVHYNQTGYNANGIEAATNTYNSIYDRTGRKARELEVIHANGRDRFQDGESLILDAGQTYQTAAMVLPMYTDTPKVTYSVADPSLCTIDEFGLITAGITAEGGATEITYACEEAGLTKNITVFVMAAEEGTAIPAAGPADYEWNFDDGSMNEKSGKNNATVSEKTGSRADYAVNKGIYTSGNRVTNFSLEKSFRISADYDWTIEWRSVLQDNSALFGTAGAATNFLYLAYCVAFDVVNPFRIVGSDGTAIMISYGDYAAYNETEMHDWKAEYKAATGTLSLYVDGSTLVGTAPVPAGWYAEFTNLFGSYSSDVDVDLKGSVDWVKVRTSQPEA